MNGLFKEYVSRFLEAGGIIAFVATDSFSAASDATTYLVRPGEWVQVSLIPVELLGTFDVPEIVLSNLGLKLAECAEGETPNGVRVVYGNDSNRSLAILARMVAETVVPDPNESCRLVGLPKPEEPLGPSEMFVLQRKPGEGILTLSRMDVPRIPDSLSPPRLCDITRMFGQ